MKKAFFRTENGYIPFESKSSRDKFVGCERKAKLSLLVANKIIKREAIKGTLLNVYSCPYCHSWHLTHKK